MNNTIKLNLLQNSQSFLIEAVEKAIGAEDDARHWQFAILNLVQSLELSLKQILKNIHPLFIYENIDNPKNTVSVTKAIERLSDENIGNITFTHTEKSGMKPAIKLRNDITHSEFELSIDYAQAHFFKVLSLLTTIQRRYFGSQIDDFLSDEAIRDLIFIEKSRELLIKNAIQRIEDEHIHTDFIFPCPNCLSDTFIVYDAIDTCYSCTHKEEVSECPQCNKLFFETDLEPIHNYFDIDYCEGRGVIHNSYGYSDIEVCSDCSQEIAQDIEEQRTTEEHNYWLEEHLLE